MQTGSDSRFDAEKVERLETVNESGRFEMQFSDSQGQKHIVSLPLSAAIALGRLICDVSEKAPFLMGGPSAKFDRK